MTDVALVDGGPGFGREGTWKPTLREGWGGLTLREIVRD